MRIQHNIMAMNAYRNYGNNVKSLSANLEKLSSGYKINRAGDDAAGLAISEKMRAQITGLNAATKNVKDGVSLVKTAEGAMQEIQDMLNRMKYLATQSANGTYDKETDRFNLQKEVDSLRAEINRIADSANFNGINLLDGKMGFGAGGAGSSPTAPTAEVDTTATDSASLTDLTIAFGEKATADDKVAINTALKDATIKVELEEAAGAATIEDTDKIEVTGLTAPSGYKVYYKDAQGDYQELTGQLTFGTAANQINKDADLELAIRKDGSTDNAATITLGLTGAVTDTTAGNKTETSFKLSSADAAGATKAPTFTENEAGGTDKTLADFGVASIDFSGVKIDAETDIKLEYDADGTDGVLKLTVGDTVYSYTAADTATNLQGAEVELDDGNGNKITVTLADDNAVIGNDVVTDNTNDIAEATVGKLAPAKSSGGNGSITLQIGDTSDDFNKLTVQIGDMHCKALGYRPGTADTTTDADGDTVNVGTYTYADVADGMSIADIDISDQTTAATAIDVIKGAINYVSSVRGDLGATQNRLDHTLNNLSVMTENIQDAESTIRDTDVAEEMMAYTKNNILIQSAQAMLAQANQVPQGVLQLLG